MHAIQGLDESTPYRTRGSFRSGEERIASREPALLYAEQDTGGLAVADHAHEVIPGSKLFSIHRFVDVRFGFALKQNHCGR